MVKFIPLTCEMCGGELSVKEDAKYITCLHCHTKFQVLQENRTAYLEKLEVSVNIETNSYRETCEIVFERNDGFLGIGGSIELWASGLGKDGEFTAGTTWETELAAEKYPVVSYRPHKDAHRCLTILLSRSGWVRTGGGSSWYNDHFERYESSDSKQSKIYKLEKDFGQLLFSIVNRYTFSLDDRLVDQQILDSRKFGENRTSIIVSAIYKLGSDNLSKVLEASPEADVYPTYQKLIAIRREIESLKISSSSS